MTRSQILRLSTFFVLCLGLYALPATYAFAGDEDEEEVIPLPLSEGKVVYSSVVSVEGVAKDELFAKARLWLPEAFKDSKDAIQVDDKENGLLLGKGKTIVRKRGIQPVVKTWGYTIKVQVKEGKFKIDMYDIDYVFEMPGNNIGATPSYMAFDEYFSDESNFKKDGSIKRGAARNIANEAGHIFKDLSEQLAKAASEKMSQDDF